MLAVNSCLTSTSLQDIIKSTAEPIIDAANYPGQVGAGRINAYQAVLASQAMYSSSIDLYTKDISHDFGVEPNPDNGPMWISDDIWVRNQNDGLTNQVHQKPEYIINSTTYNYVYVRVRNKSCVASDGTEQLKLYWAKAATALAWPSNWNGATISCTNSLGLPTTPELGNQIGTGIIIPIIPAGGETILEIPWYVPNPDDYYGCNPEPWHFCLLTRIDASNDPMTFAEGTSIYDNAKNNNNIAWKNLTIVDILPGIAQDGDCWKDRQVGGVIAIGNAFDKADNYKLEFKLPDIYKGKPIIEQAEIKVTLDDLSWEKWQQGGFQGNNLKIKREDCHQLVITGNPATLENLTFQPFERSTINLSFNFLTDKVDATPEFDYYAIQKCSQDNKIIGGELYRIRKPYRSLFGADAGTDKTISKNTSTTLSANSIGETAYYNWYNPAGELIYTGNNFTVSPEITTKYKLQVISTSDGFSSYDSVIVKVKECEIQTLTPNPASNQVTIAYHLENITSAYLIVTQIGTSVNNNYILNVGQNTASISLANYPQGNYNIVLACDGVIKDEKILIIQ